MDEHEKIVNYFLERIDRGEIEFDQIRKELEEKNLEDKSITNIIRKVDEELLHQVSNQHRLANLKRLAIFGAALMLFGFIFTISSFLGLFQTDQHQIIVFAYGPLFSGLFILLAAMRRKNLKRNLFSANKSFFNRGKINQD